MAGARSERPGKDINFSDLHIPFGMIPSQESESVLKETLIRNVGRIEFASLFGSFRRGLNDFFSDIDVFVVCEARPDKGAIANGLTRLGLRIGKQIDVTIFSLKDFEERMRNHDYLTASILNDSKFIFGDENSFLRGKREIFRRTVDAESVEFNRRMGLKMLKGANDRLENLLYKASSAHNLDFSEMGVLLGCLRDHHVGLGYLAASAKMGQQNRAVTVEQLLASDHNSPMKDLILTEKGIRRQGIVNFENIKDLFERSKRLRYTLSPL